MYAIEVQVNPSIGGDDELQLVYADVVVVLVVVWKELGKYGHSLTPQQIQSFRYGLDLTSSDQSM